MISTPALSSTSSQSPAGSGPIMALHSAATRVPSMRPPPGCRRRTVGRILPSLSTGLDRARGDGPDPRLVHEIGRKRARLGGGDDHLPLARHLAQEGAAT